MGRTLLSLVAAIIVFVLAMALLMVAEQPNQEVVLVGTTISHRLVGDVFQVSGDCTVTVSGAYLTISNERRTWGTPAPTQVESFSARSGDVFRVSSTYEVMITITSETGTTVTMYPPQGAGAAARVIPLGISLLLAGACYFAMNRRT